MGRFDSTGVDQEDFLRLMRSTETAILIAR